jgi:hypothetical protein
MPTRREFRPVIPSRSLYRVLLWCSHHPVASVNQGYRLAHYQISGATSLTLRDCIQVASNFNQELILADRRLRIYKVGIILGGGVYEERKKDRVERGLSGSVVPVEAFY